MLKLRSGEARTERKEAKRKENMADFFKKDEEKVVEEDKKEEEKIETIKVGDKEYTQEELSRKVGLGDLADELESKWNTKIDRLYPEYTKSTQENTELRKYKDEQEKLKVEEKEKKGEELSPEEYQKKVISEAEKFGFVHKDNVNQYIASFLGARDLIDDAEAVVANAEEDGKPKTTVQGLLDYMSETGIKNPSTAYKARYEKELDTWKEQQLAKVKQSGMETLNSSSAGSKEPELPKLTDLDSLREAMRTRFRRNQ